MKKLKINEAIQVFKKNNPNVKMDKTVLAEKIVFKNYNDKSIAQLLRDAINGSDKNVPFEIIRQTADILGVSLEFLIGKSNKAESVDTLAKLIKEKIEHISLLSLELNATLNK